MLSRTADHLFWMARYTERADNRFWEIEATADMSEANVKVRSAGQSHNTPKAIAAKANVSEANVKARSAGRRHNTACGVRSAPYCEGQPC